MTTGTKYAIMRNGSVPVPIADIPVLDYNDFYDEVSSLLHNSAYHCLIYFCYRTGTDLKFICCIADDSTGEIMIFSHVKADDGLPLRSLAESCTPMHVFEREIHERHGVGFTGHPWLKPVRYPYNRADSDSIMDNYPFYKIDGEELHEVGVGPIHAGVIEPGHFRFICNGEKVLHLEIQLGYQHRNIEKLFVETDSALIRSVLAENIAGDTATGHGLAHAQLTESLAGYDPSKSLQIERCIALEMERIAVHIGDTAALCCDVAYQLGQVACEALRTMVINTTQTWCGNRFGKSLIRPGGSNFTLKEDMAAIILDVLGEVDRRYGNVTDCLYSVPTVLSRFEETGTVTRQQAVLTGALGMAARSCGFMRDIRVTHPFQYYRQMKIISHTIDSGDVLARSKLRALEVKESVKIIRGLIDMWRMEKKNSPLPEYNLKFEPDSLSVSLTEGWRGEICHAAVTDNKGMLLHYRIKDPSLHNWMALALAVRNQEISDFPVCNKSFNLSYCGHDL